MAYERKIDLMDESLFPADSLYAQRKNPKTSISTDVFQAKQTNDEIIDFVVKEMSDTLGNVHASKSN